MNLSEATKVVAVLKSIYLREQFTEGSPAAFQMLLDDIAYDDVMAAVMIHGKRSKWCPTPSELRDILTEQTVTHISPGEAFAIVQKQINRHGADGFANVTFDDPAIMAAVKAVGWKRICLEDRSKGDYVLRDFTEALERAQRSVRLAVQDGTAAIGGGNVTALDRRAS